jgi:hypothetical protein
MSEDRGRRADRPGSERRPAVAANDNVPANGHALAETSGLAVSGPADSVPVAANDNHVSIVRSAANDNDILVSDDLPRPLPIAVGEAELVRKLLGERFRQILEKGAK